tara:strand:+ start:4754 stop:5062 length:309 start_codon:yes stop_codon:yes gene_type:complete
MKNNIKTVGTYPVENFKVGKYGTYQDRMDLVELYNIKPVGHYREPMIDVCDNEYMHELFNRYKSGIEYDWEQSITIKEFMGWEGIDVLLGQLNLPDHEVLVS